MTATDIQTILERRNWSKADLAAACFVSVRTVENWLNGRTIRAAVLPKLRALLRRSPKAVPDPGSFKGIQG